MERNTSTRGDREGSARGDLGRLGRTWATGLALAVALSWTLGACAEASEAPAVGGDLSSDGSDIDVHCAKPDVDVETDTEVDLPTCPGEHEQLMDGRCVCVPVAGDCGNDGCGGALPGCVKGWGEDGDSSSFEPKWTLCDESTHTCALAPPEAHCADGWCRVPATTFLAGGERTGLAGIMYIWPRHPVSITRPFEIQQTEVTQAQWLDVMGLTPADNPASAIAKACGLDCPVTAITFFDMLEFANRLSEAAGLEACYALEGCNDQQPGRGYFLCETARYVGPSCAGYRLPSEFEWALAAGAGANTCWPTGEPDYAFESCAIDSRLDPYAWYCGNCSADYSPCLESSLFLDETGGCCGFHPVAQKEPNPFGLYDTAGNALEATWSRFRDPGEPHPALDPGQDLVMNRNDQYVRRGGGWNSAQRRTCTWMRVPECAWIHKPTPDWPEPEDCKGLGEKLVGLRLVRTLPQAGAAAPRSARDANRGGSHE